MYKFNRASEYTRFGMPPIEHVHDMHSCRMLRQMGDVP